MHVSRLCFSEERWQCGTEVSVKIACEEEKRWFEIGAYVAIMERMLISEIKRRKVERKQKERRGVE